MVDPPTRDLRQAVQAGNGRLSKEPGEDVTADTTDGVSRKDIYTSGRVRVSAPFHEEKVRGEEGFRTRGRGSRKGREEGGGTHREPRRLGGGT